MISKTMGRRYSKALMALALEKNEPLEDLLEELEDISEALTSDPRILHLLTNPNILLGERLKMLGKLLATLNPRPLVNYFLQLLLQKGRLLFLPDIALEFRKLADQQAGVVRASVISAAELSPEETEKIRNLLHHQFEKKIVLSVNVDPELIGGLIIKVGSLSFDGSIRSQLKAIQSQLIEEVTFS